MVVLLVRELAAQIGGHVRGDGDRPIAGVSTPEAAGPTDLVLAEDPLEARHLERSRAAAAIVPRGVSVPAPIVGIETDQPGLAMARAIDLLVPPVRTWRTISPQALVASSAFVAEGAGIGPFAVIGEGARIGRHCEIHPHVVIGPGCEIGDGSVLHAGARLYPLVILGQRVTIHAGAVIGADGLGYVAEAAGAGALPAEPLRYRRVRHVGRVVVEDDVEIGANATIDRAAFTETRIGRGTRIDHLVTIGHTCRIGRHCIITGQAVVLASTALDDYATVVGHAPRGQETW